MSMIAERTDIQDAADVREFVDAFYNKVRRDEILSVIFDHVAGVDWGNHLPQMYQFWETILLHREGYRGNPIETHVQLDADMRFDHGIGLAAIDFDRWLALFCDTIDQRFEGRRAEMAKRGATRMADHMQRALSL